MSSLRRTALPTLLASALLVLGGCGDDTGATQSAPAHNAADVTFASQMVPHHEQALEMVAMTEGRSLSPDLEHLTGHVHDAQQPEIETLTGWLEEWDEAVHVHHDGHEMAGMVSAEDLVRLDAAEGKTFERLWLRLMIAHHEGAIEMANTQLAKGSYDPATELAQSIVDSQSHEIEEMRGMLRG